MIGEAVAAGACGAGLAGRAFALAAPKAGEARHRTPEVRRADKSFNRVLLEPETQAIQDRKRVYARSCALGSGPPARSGLPATPGGVSAARTKPENLGIET